jgi:MFS family permease
MTAMQDKTMLERVASVPATAWFGLAILMIFYLMSFLDKQMLSLLANPIGQSLKLSDTTLGLLQGVAFSITYSIGTLVTGAAVDRYSPRRIILLGMIFWSLAAMASGLTNSFSGLFAARMGVGLGESVLSPASIVLIVAMFPRARMGVAMGIYMVGANLGGVIALLGGSAAIEALTGNGGITLPLIGYREPWQAALILTGAPGVAIAFLIFAIRRSTMGAAATPGQARRAGDAVPLWPYVSQHRRFILIHYALIAALGMAAYTLISWSPAYFGRAFGWSHEKIGLILALGVGMGGIGNVLWGAVSDWLRRRGHPDALYALFPWLMLLSVPVSVAAFIINDGTVAAILYPLSWLLANSWGPMNGAMPFAVPDSIRGRATAAQTFVVGVFGIGMAPLIVGGVSDLLGGKSHIGPAIALVLAADAVLAFVLMRLGRNAYRAALAAREEPPLVMSF